MSTLRLGVAGEIVPTDPLALTPERAQALAALGISTLVTHMAPTRALVGALGVALGHTLHAEGLRIAQLAGVNASLVCTAMDGRDEALRRLALAFEVAQVLGAESVLTGCGSLHSRLFYGPDRRNHLPETRLRLIDALRAAEPLARAAGIPLVLECHLLTTLDTPAHIAEVLNAVDSPWVRTTFDPVNLIGSLPQLYASGGAIRSMAAMLRHRYAACAHFKDIDVGSALVLHLHEAEPGSGILDFPAFFAACALLPDGAALIVEHLPAARVPAALRFARRAAASAGVRLLP